MLLLSDIMNLIIKQFNEREHHHETSLGASTPQQLLYPCDLATSVNRCRPSDCPSRCRHIPYIPTHSNCGTRHDSTLNVPRKHRFRTRSSCRDWSRQGWWPSPNLTGTTLLQADLQWRQFFHETRSTPRGAHSDNLPQSSVMTLVSIEDLILHGGIACKL